MKIQFVKYQGAGNDFILLNNLDGSYDSLSMQTIIAICDRKFGVGADGLIKLNASKTVDFYCDYYNSDGTQSFCGNGARCIVTFAKEIGIVKENYVFDAIDGIHEAHFENELVNLKMNDVSSIKEIASDSMAIGFELNTGSPHFIRFCTNLDTILVKEEGQKIRYSEAYKKEGINVNFISTETNDLFSIRTYERGVEDETLACGTGITAAALVLAKKNNIYGKQEIKALTSKDELLVRFNRLENDSFSDIRLIGPAVKVFEGVYVE